MLQESKHIKELFHLKHINDNTEYKPVDYENNILRKTTSNLLWRNPNLNEYLQHFQKLIVCMLEGNLIVRNFFNFTVDKYYNKHLN